MSLWRSFLRASIRFAARTVALLYLAGLVLLFLFQRSVLYPAPQMSEETFRAEVLRRYSADARILEPFKAVDVPPLPGVPLVGVALVFHGNGELALDRRELVAALTRHGYRAILAEYPGYGARGGKPSQDIIVDDAIELYRRLRVLYADEPMVLVGASLGSGVAVQVASKLKSDEAPARLILVTPYLSISETAARQFPFFPARWLVLDRFDSQAALPAYRGSVAIAVADSDEVVGAEQGLLLAKVAQSRGPTRLIVMQGTGHNDWSSRATETQWQELLGQPL